MGPRWSNPRDCNLCRNFFRPLQKNVWNNFRTLPLLDKFLTAFLHLQKFPRDYLLYFLSSQFFFVIFNKFFWFEASKIIILGSKSRFCTPFLTFYSQNFRTFEYFYSDLIYLLILILNKQFACQMDKMTTKIYFILKKSTNKWVKANKMQHNTHHHQDSFFYFVLFLLHF